MIKLFLKLNSFFKLPDHPFNKAKNGVFNLNYSDFEFKSAPELFEKYDRFGDFISKIKNKKVADFACGGGGKSIYLATKGAKEVWGIDLSEKFIKQANKMAKDQGVESKCHFLFDDAVKSSLESNYFDYVIFNDAIEHIPDTEGTIKEALRILKPGGQIYINFEAYYFFFGHHLWDALPIPWLHLFTSEKFRIKLYKEAVKKFPDGDERIKFRISKNKNGQEEISYLNRITVSKFEKIVAKLEKNKLAIVKHFYLSTLNRKILKFLAKLPILREMFLSTIYFVLEKPYKCKKNMKKVNPNKSNISKLTKS